jgi:PPP family 3-phenylpropionic acid transporter
MSDGEAVSSGLWRLRVAVFAQMAGVGIDLAFATVWMNRIGAGETLIGVLTGLSTLIIFLTGLGWGRLADQSVRPHRLVMLAYVLIAAAWVALALSREPWHLTGYMLLKGLSWAGFMSLLPTLAMAALGPDRAGLRYSTYRMFGSAGFIVGTLVIPLILPEPGWLFFAAAAIALLAPLPLIGMADRPVPQQAYASLGRVLRNRELVALLAGQFCYALALPAIFHFLPLYAEQLGASDRFIGVMISVNGWVALAALPAAGLIVDRFGHRRLIVASLIVQPVRVMLYILVDTPPLLLPIQLLHAVSWAGVEVAGVLHISAVVAAGNRATAMALFYGVQTLGVFLGALGAGYLAEHHGYRWMFFASASAAALGPVLFLAAGTVRSPARERG